MDAAEAGYPAAAALARRRRAAAAAAGPPAGPAAPAGPDDPPLPAVPGLNLGLGIGQQPQHQPQQQQQQQPQQQMRTSHAYCLLSAFVALLAIVTSSVSTPPFGGGGAVVNANVKGKPKPGSRAAAAHGHAADIIERYAGLSGGGSSTGQLPLPLTTVESVARAAAAAAMSSSPSSSPSSSSQGKMTRDGDGKSDGKGDGSGGSDGGGDKDFDLFRPVRDLQNLILHHGDHHDKQQLDDADSEKHSKLHGHHELLKDAQSDGSRGEKEGSGGGGLFSHFRSHHPNEKHSHNEKQQHDKNRNDHHDEPNDDTTMPPPPQQFNLNLLPPGLRWLFPALSHRFSFHAGHHHHHPRDATSTSSSDAGGSSDAPHGDHRPPPSPQPPLRSWTLADLHLHNLSPRRVSKSMLTFLTNLIDPSIRSLLGLGRGGGQHQDGQHEGEGSGSSEEGGGSVTEVIDKVLTSTPRLLAIANLLLAVTYLLHGFVADFFLGTGTGSVGATTAAATGAQVQQAAAAMAAAANPAQAQAAQAQAAAAAAAAAQNVPNNNQNAHQSRLTRTGRERLGGYLLFKLLLISAVVEPDTLDLLILLSWYTLLSFLRSLAHLAGSTASHAAQSGRTPPPGVLRLLIVVLLSDICAAAVCAALFHGAGWGTVLLLASDCALLAVDVICHVARHAGGVLEERHSRVLEGMEERQLRLHARMRENNARARAGGPAAAVVRPEDGRDGGEEEEEAAVAEAGADRDDDDINIDDNRGIDGSGASQPDAPTAANDDGDGNGDGEDESRLLDRQMEFLEAVHSRRLTVLDTVVYVLELVAYSLTVCHFLHIWSLHGVSFGLVDGVLALHLHSAVTAMGRKIAERRNLNRIARELDGFFKDATELEMRKASAAGDVCCICLGTMSAGNVKKVGCGHLYHTHCLREVVERARSIEAARCPLCRASVVDGRQVRNNNNGAGNANGNGNDAGIPNEQQPQADGAQQQQQMQPPQQQAQQQQNQGVVGGGGGGGEDHALFRFSTEGILPNWIPLPAFSFEVVRRPPAAAAPQDNGNINRGNNDDNAVQQAPPRRGNNANNNEIAEDDLQQQNQGQQQQQTEIPFWRRLLVLAGAIPMSAEQEQEAIEQLVDMFPQYERSDLLRELRARGSAEGVVEAVLAGLFSGVPRGGVGVVAGDEPFAGAEYAVRVVQPQEVAAAPEDDVMGDELQDDAEIIQDEDNSLLEDQQHVLEGEVNEPGGDENQ